MPVPSALFDEIAPGYDAGFERNVVGRYMRRRLWGRLSRLVSSGQDIADLGCGTGSDAVYLARLGCRVTCVDCSRTMLSQLSIKALESGMTAALRIRHVDFTSDSFQLGRDLFDGILISFGSLNYAEDPVSLFRILATALRPHGWCAIMSLNPLAPWDILSYSVNRRPAWAINRIRSRQALEAVRQYTVPMYYYSRGAILRCGRAAGLHHETSESLGCFVPPAYLASTIFTSTPIFRCLSVIEKAMCHLPVFRSIGDFVLVILRK